MPLYEIQIPVFDNEGGTTQRKAEIFDRAVATFCGGYSKLPVVQSAWMHKGQLYEEPMTPYHIACEAHKFEQVLDLAFYLFSDQIAIFTAKIGTPAIFNRETRTLAGVLWLPSAVAE